MLLGKDVYINLTESWKTFEDIIHVTMFPMLSILIMHRRIGEHFLDPSRYEIDSNILIECELRQFQVLLPSPKMPLDIPK